MDAVERIQAGGPGINPRGGEGKFFTVMAVAAALTVFIGFAPSYFLKGVFDGPPLSFLLHLHGAVFTGWILLFILQVRLVAAGRLRLHQKMGIGGALLAFSMLVVGMAAAIDSASRGFTPPGGPPPLVFLVIPVGDLVQFGALVGTGLALRRRPSAHKRLMLLATLGLLTPAIARFPIIRELGPLAFFGLTDLFIIACLIYDRVAFGRIHPAFFWGGLAMILSQPLRMVIGGTEAWLAFARWVTG
jgi:hypothetical protein